MRVNLFFIFCLCLCSLMISCQRKNSDDDLAERMSKSENFKAIMSYGKDIAGFVKPLPESIKVRLKENKQLIDLVQNNKSLSVRQKGDSILRIIKSTSLYDSIIKDSTLMNNGRQMTIVYKKFYNEFPEFKNLPEEERKKVFKKAANILLANQKHKS